MNEYIAGEFYSKYYMDEDVNVDRVIIVEHSLIGKIINTYKENAKKEESEYAITNAANNNCDSILEIDQKLSNLEEELVKDPHQFLKLLKKLKKEKSFFNYVMEFDKQNAIHEKKVREERIAWKRQRQLISYVLAVGVLLGVMIHQLMSLF